MPFARGFGVWELVIILVIVMIIFGVGRLPEIGNSMGKAIREFKKSQSDKDDEAAAQENKSETNA